MFCDINKRFKEERLLKQKKAPVVDISSGAEALELLFLIECFYARLCRLIVLYCESKSEEGNLSEGWRKKWNPFSPFLLKRVWSLQIIWLNEPFALEQGQKPELEWLTEAGNAQCHVITYR